MKIIKLLFICLCFGFSFKKNDNPITGADVIAYAQSLKGITYKYGGINPKTGFDCSGFVMHVFSKFKINLPHSSSGQSLQGKAVNIANAEAGDIVIFKGTQWKTNPNVGHVGIVISYIDGKLLFIHASSSSSKGKYGVIETYLHEGKYSNRFLGIRRVLK